MDLTVNKKYRGSDEDKIISYLKDISVGVKSIRINSVITDANMDSLWDAIDKLKDVKNIEKIHTIPLFVTKHIIAWIKAAPIEKHEALLKLGKR